MQLQIRLVLSPALVQLASNLFRFPFLQSALWLQLPERLSIRLSIAAQSLGVLGLILATLCLGLGGVLLGLVWAALLQAASAKWFIKHLSAIALNIGQPGIVVSMEQLRQRLTATTLSVYGSATIAFVVLQFAFYLGLFMWGIGFLVTVPLAFVMIAPLIIACMTLYFLMLFSYEHSLRQLRSALYFQAKINEAMVGSSGNA